MRVANLDCRWREVWWEFGLAQDILEQIDDAIGQLIAVADRALAEDLLAAAPRWPNSRMPAHRRPRAGANACRLDGR